MKHLNNRLFASLLLVVVCAATLVTAQPQPVSAETASIAAPSGEDTPVGRAKRVLVYSVPTLTFMDLQQTDLPNLGKLLEHGSVADLSVRTVYRTNRPADGYATLNAGTRTRGTSLANLAFIAGVPRGGASDADGDPVTVPQGAFEDVAVDPEAGKDVITGPDDVPVDPNTLPPEAGEPYRGIGTPAAEEFARRTGVTPPIGSVFNFGLVSIKSLNDRLLFDSEIGALGNALKEADVSRAVIANGDHGPGLDDLDFRREATLALMDSDGLVEAGRVGRSLLEASPSAPFGAQYDIDRVVSSFEKFYKDRSVVIVEASDMVRSEEAKSLSAPTQQALQRREALKRSDELLGRLLKSVDLDHDAVMILSPYASGYDNGLTAFGIVSPGAETGLLVSGTTRRDGFVQTVDIAPTILSLVGAKMPTSMEGTVIESVPDSRTLAEKGKFLDDAYRGAVFRDSTIGGASTFFVVIQLVIWGAAVWAMTRRGRGTGIVVEIAALGVLAFLPATYMAGALPFHRWGGFAYWAFLVGVSTLLAVACYFPTRRYLVDPLMTMLALMIAFLSADIVTGGALQFNTVFGYTPTVAGRFDGMGNPAFSMFTAAAIILAALLAYRIPGRRGTWAGVTLLVWVVILDVVPIWGADVGGALALIPTVGVMVMLLLGYRVKLSTGIWLSVLTVVAVIGLGLLDLLRPPTSRTHLGRLLSNTYENGFGAFVTVVLRKLNANLSVLTSSVWTLMLPVVFIFIALVFWRAPWRLRTISNRIPQERAAVVGLSLAMVLGFALNDSGISIPGMMLGVISASLVHLMVRANSEQFPAETPPAVTTEVPRSVDSQPAGGEQSALT